MEKPDLELISKLGSIAASLSSINDISTLSYSLDAIVEGIAPSDYNTLFLFDDEKGQLELHNSDHFSKKESLHDAIIEIKKHADWVFQHKNNLLLDDLKINHGSDIDSTILGNKNSVLLLPVMCLDKIVGVFGMMGSEDNSFQKEHVALITFVCDLVGVVYNNIVLEKKQKSITANLKKSKEQFETLFESFPDAIFIHDYRKIKKINSSFLQLFEYDHVDEVIGIISPESILVDADKQSKDILGSDDMIASSFVPQLQLKKKNGSNFLAEIYVSHVKINDLSLAQVTVRDITERKKIEDKLNKEEQKSVLIKQAEQVPGIIYQYKIDDQGNKSYPFASGKMLAFFNTNSEEIIEGKTEIFDNILDEDRDMFEESLKASIQELKDWSLDYRVNTRLKGIRWIRGNSKPIKMPDGSITWHGYITDITENKIAEDALLDSERQIKTMFDYAPDSVIVVDKKGNVTKWNPKAESMFGWSSAEIIQMNIFNTILPNQSYQSFFTSKDINNNDENNQNIEIIAKKKNGSSFPISAAISIMKIKQEDFYIIFISDISIRKQSEDKIKQSLIEKNVLLKEIHHRIKNNMQVITSLLSLQSSFITEDHIKDQFMSSQYRIHSMGMVHEMLYQSEDVSRIDFGNYITELIEGLVHGMKGENNQVELIIECPELHLNLDTAIPLGLIINEIITNSLKYGIIDNNKGKIFLHLNPLEYPKFELEIGDDGPGFSTEYDFRNSKSLGIMLIHNLIKQLNGQIQRENEQRGSVYKLIFEEV